LRHIWTHPVCEGFFQFLTNFSKDRSHISGI
jgi:hypothetical protein